MAGIALSSPTYGRNHCGCPASTKTRVPSSEPLDGARQRPLPAIAMPGMGLAIAGWRSARAFDVTPRTYGLLESVMRWSRLRSPRALLHPRLGRCV